MDAAAPLNGRLQELAALFNRRSLDLPHGLFARGTQFLLNGVSFEEWLGRPAADPLVLMLTRGPAGYRFSVKAIQHAVPDARLECADLAPIEIDGRPAYRTECRLTGHLRGTERPADVTFIAELVPAAAGALDRVNIRLDEPALMRLREARGRP